MTETSFSRKTEASIKRVSVGEKGTDLAAMESLSSMNRRLMGSQNILKRANVLGLLCPWCLTQSLTELRTINSTHTVSILTPGNMETLQEKAVVASSRQGQNLQRKLERPKGHPSHAPLTRQAFLSTQSFSLNNANHKASCNLKIMPQLAFVC